MKGQDMCFIMRRKIAFLTSAAVICALFFVARAQVGEGAQSSGNREFFVQLEKAEQEFARLSVQGEATGTLEIAETVNGQRVSHMEKVDPYLFALKGNKAYFEHAYNGVRDQTVLDDNTLFRLIQGAGAQKSYLSFTVLSPSQPAIDPIRVYEADFCLRYGIVPLSRALQTSTSTSIKHEADGKWEVSANLGSEEKAVIVFDATRSFKVTKWSTEQTNGLRKTEQQITAFENIGGVWVPTRMQMKTFTRTKPSEPYQLANSLARIVGQLTTGDAVRDEIFRLKPTDGLAIYDIDTNQIYKFYSIGTFDGNVHEATAKAGAFLRGDFNEVPDDMSKKAPRSLAFCGPYALLAWCDLLGIKANSKELANLAETSFLGASTLQGLQRAALAKGINCEGMQLTLEDWQQAGRKPALVVGRSNSSHIYFVAGARDGRVVVFDPPARLQILPENSAELKDIWGDVALVTKQEKKAVQPAVQPKATDGTARGGAQ